MEFGALGPLRVVAAGRVVPVMAARQRAVLGILMLRANRAVSIPQLIDGVWGEHQPTSAHRLVHTYVWRLRRLLGQPAGGGPLIVGPWGYLLQAHEGELDIAGFERLVSQARAIIADGDPAGGAATLRSALALWRGEPLEDVVLHGEYALELERLAGQRAIAHEERIAADLACGRHDLVIAEIEQLLDAHPLRESLIAKLMLALHLAGRRSEALGAFQRARAQLADELGLDPTAELRHLHQQILADDPALRPAAPAGIGPRPDVPMQLPAAAAHFVGRVAELSALTELLDPTRVAGGTVVISAIQGTAGIGKTALAVRFAHRAAPRFPDGQLYINLRGFDPAGPPVPPGDAIRAFLQALGVPADRLPSSLDGQVSTYRTVLAVKRVLVVLDNARDAAQVRPLIPGNPSCLVIVTSRRQLCGLAATDAARVITLDLLTSSEARDLLASRLGAERVASEPSAVDNLIALCARLPLALSIAAARAATEPALTLASLAADLRDVRTRLDVLDAGDLPANARAVFSWSYQNLSPPAARLFRLLGLHPGPDVSTAAAASLAGVGPSQTRGLLRELTAAHMVAEHARGRHALHDLLRIYAAEQARAVDRGEGEGEGDAAMHRLLDHYLHTAHAAAVLLDPTRDQVRLPSPQPGTTLESITSHEQALAWFEAELPVLLAIVTWAEADGFDLHAGKIPWALTTYLHRCGHWHEWAATQRTALAAATRSADRAGQAHAHLDLGYAHARLGEFDDSSAHLRCSLDLYGQLDDPFNQARVHNAFAITLEQQGRPGESLEHARSALRLCQISGHPAGQANALNAVGWYSALTGDCGQALVCCRQALDLHRELGDRDGEAATWDSLGYAHHHLGHHAEAADCYQRALNLYMEIGARYYQTDTLVRLGETHQAAGNSRAARAAWQRALAILDDLNLPDSARVRAKLRELDQHGPLHSLPEDARQDGD